MSFLKIKKKIKINKFFVEDKKKLEIIELFEDKKKLGINELVMNRLQRTNQYTYLRRPFNESLN